MYLLFLLIFIAVLLSITYVYVLSWKLYIKNAWNNGLRKALELKAEELIKKEVLLNNKKITAAKLYYSILDYRYWRYSYLLNIENSALNYFMLQNEDSMESFLNFKDNEILDISDEYKDFNRPNLKAIKEKYKLKDDQEVKSFILEFKKGKNK